MTVMTERRYPLQPLLDHTGLTRRQLRTALGISHTRLIELATAGLTDEAADRYAIRLGHYPWQIWTTWFADATPHWDPDHPSVRGVPPRPSSSEQP